MYYRRKLLLSVLEQTKKQRLHKINFQKALFLISQAQKTSYFDFLPYKYGCFSFQANKDLAVLSHHYKLIKNNETEWVLGTKEHNYFASLHSPDQEAIYSVFKGVDVENTSELMSKVYDDYPYYTIYSQRTLSPKQKKNQQLEIDKIKTNKKEIFSIGYEGMSIDAYINTLIKNNITLLCDVRKNPFSMKYGFSKNQISKYCQELHIEYAHLPSLGIESRLRQNLNSSEDYKKLFIEYKSNLEGKSVFLQDMQQLIKQYKRVAFTCFEKDYHCCHRFALLNYYNETMEKITIHHL